MKLKYMPENGSKFISWSAGKVIVTITGAIIGGLFLLAQAGFSTAQDNRVNIQGTKTNIETIKDDISIIQKDIRILINK